MCADASVCVCVRILRRPACAHRHESIRTHADTHTEKHPHYVDQHTCSSALLRYICVPYYCMCVLIPDPPAGAAPGFVVHRNDSLESRLSALTSHVSQVLPCYIYCIFVRILCMRRRACVQQACEHICSSYRYTYLAGIRRLIASLGPGKSHLAYVCMYV
jgi:hypothetical protein